MISTVSMAGMVLQGVLSIGAVFAAFIYFYKKERFSWKTVGVGALIFFVFSQVLEKLLHLYVLTVNPVAMAWMKQPMIYALYGSLAAGVFEEVGRWTGFKLLLKKRRDYKDGIGFGLGHGGIEAFLIGVITAVQYLIYAVMINTGTFDREIGSKLPAETVNQLKNQLADAAFYEYLLGGLERAAAMLIHIALSLVVLYGIRTAQSKFLLYAILLHAGFDFIAALYQVHVLPLLAAELVILLVGALSFRMIRRARFWGPFAVSSATRL